MEFDTIYNEDCITGIAKLPDNSVDCCVTSPPYYGLRDYGVDGQIGLEDTPEQYVAVMVDVFREVRRVLKPTGTLWLNLGDSYAGSGKGAWAVKDRQKETYIPDPDSPQCSMKVPQGLKPKDLIGIPWRVALALQADGWYLRQDIIWAKPNPMPESVTDRCTKAHEYIFLLTKSARYYYDHEAIKEPCVENSDVEYRKALRAEKEYDCKDPYKKNTPYANRKYYPPAGSVGAFGPRQSRRRVNENNDGTSTAPEATASRNRRSVWTVATKPYSEAHFATFPEALIEPCILAGCPKDGVVLDPFMGSGTTARVAVRFGRHYIGYELNPDYIKLCGKRTDNVQLKMI